MDLLARSAEYPFGLVECCVKDSSGDATHAYTLREATKDTRKRQRRGYEESHARVKRRVFAASHVLRRRRISAAPSGVSNSGAPRGDLGLD